MAARSRGERPSLSSMQAQEGWADRSQLGRINPCSSFELRFAAQCKAVLPCLSTCWAMLGARELQRLSQYIGSNAITLWQYATSYHIWRELNVSVIPKCILKTAACKGVSSSVPSTANWEQVCTMSSTTWRQPLFAAKRTFTNIVYIFGCFMVWIQQM